MKMFLLYSFIASVLVSNSYAQSAKSDWSVIRKQKRISILEPEFSKFFGPLGIFNVCVDRDKFKSIEPVNVCTSYKEIRNGIPNSELGQTIDQKCVEMVVKDVTIPRTMNKEVCKERVTPSEISANECIKWETETINLPTSYNLVAVRSRSFINGELAGEHLFKKLYVIPECK